MMRMSLIAMNLVAPAVAILLWLSGHGWAGLAVIFTVHMLTLVATLVPACSWWGPQLAHLAEGDAAVWLTIDDGPDPDDTPAILEILRARDARATFFLIGEKAERWPHLVRAIRDAGHGIGNHTMTHPKFSFWRHGAKRIRAEISEAQQVIAVIAGRRPTLFRAPAGMRNPFVHPVLGDLDLQLVGWSVRGRDGVSVDRDAIVGRLSRGINPGAIVLMHEGMRDGEGRSVIVDTLPRVLDVIELRGLRPVLPGDDRSA